MLRVAIPYGVLSSHAAAQARAHRPHLRPRLRPLHHAAEHPVQLAAARGGARHSGRTGRSRHARDPDQRQLHPQHDVRPVCRRRRRRDHRPAPVVRARPPMVDAASRVRPPAAQVQDRRDRRDRTIARRSWSTTSARRPCATRPAKSGFRVAVGGGQGRTPIIGHVIREFLPGAELLNYFDAILRVYNRFGRRDNKFKARIKILVKEMTPAEFTRRVELEWERLRGGPGTVPAEEIERLAAHFTDPPYREIAAGEPRLPRRAGRQPSVFAVGGAQRHAAQAHRLRDRHAVAQEDRRAAGRRVRDADGRHRRPRRALHASASCASRTSRTWYSPTCCRPTCTTCGRG